MILETQGLGSVHIGKEDIEMLGLLIRHILPQKTDFLNQKIEYLQHFYRKADWIDRGIPYEQMAGRQALSGPGWMRLVWTPEPFQLPIELEGHRKRMIEQFQKQGKMRFTASGKLDDQLCPRVSRFLPEQNQLQMQQARYTDQVGTNLSLDYPLEQPLAGYGETLRAIDRKYALEKQNLHKHHLSAECLRPLEDSFLANTLGVACMITYRTCEIFFRRRSLHTAVYSGMAHVPVSFAAELNSRADTLEQLVMDDLKAEFQQETGLAFDDCIERVTPLALCRDIGRGGKPQLFLNLQAGCPLQDLLSRVHQARSAPEYKKDSAVVPKDYSFDDDHTSPELCCGSYLLLRS